MERPLSLRFIGAQVLGPDGVGDGTIAMENGVLTDAASRDIDAAGYLILPGIIDLHGDGFEHHMAPRRGAQTDPQLGLRAVEAELAANGITTAVLAQFFSWEGGMRGPDFAEALIAAVGSYASALDLRIQLRFEFSLLEAFDRVKALIEHENIGYVVLNDHLNHTALSVGKRPPRLVGQALKSGRSPDDHMALLTRLHEQTPAALDALPELTNWMTARGVKIGSHDDTTPDTRARFRALGAKIAEFPETRAAAEAAHAAGDPVIMGAPNVVRGGSHDGKIGARDLIADGLVDALVSDYHYPAPHRAALALWDDGLPLHQAWALISGGPARVMGWSDRGTLAQGSRADLIVMDATTRRIEGVFSAGRAAYLCGPFAARLIGP
ncbi:alpha-D-ribose 1-methylphosphonate 5-triphosphate diphosphatase [Gymnodinialimonas ulvae]|uniref:alpha-D-ribose 1-methylphosphonate 5-triphosphate diphosphatase n=1 Tax=Gymnodinialimonas ulvae TaxID=3126504 RepID=UPI0030A2ED94